MKKVLIFLMALLIMIPSLSYAMDLMEHSTLRITIVDNNRIYEWEFENPDKYEYEIGEKVIKGEKAKKEVMELINKMELHEKAKVEDLVTQLKENGFDQMQRLDIRLMTLQGKLFTWIWEKN